MDIFLMVVTLIAGVLGSSVMNRFAKKELKNFSDNLLYTFGTSLVCMVVLLAAGGWKSVHIETVLLAALFGLCQFLASVLSTATYQKGPMSLSSVIMLGGNLILTVAIGTIFFDGSITTWQIVGIVLVLAAIFLSSNVKKEKNITKAWVVLTIIAAVTNASLGIIQKVQGNAAYHEEQMQFLFWTFFFVLVFNAMALLFNAKVRKITPTLNLKSRLSWLILLVGVTTVTQHIINLILVAKLPAAVFFPVNSGGRIVILGLVGTFIFKEKLSWRQVTAIIIGILAILLLGGVFG